MKTAAQHREETGCDVDNAAPALSAQVWECDARHIPRAGEIHIHEALPHLGMDLLDAHEIAHVIGADRPHTDRAVVDEKYALRPALGLRRRLRARMRRNPQCRFTEVNNRSALTSGNVVASARRPRSFTSSAATLRALREHASH
jgi:hypothetical protein